MRRGLGCVLVLLAAVVSLAPARVAADPTDPVRILIVGDSVAQGSSGDWTWRYRVWQALTQAGVDVDFVGPSDDLFDNVTFTFGSQEYADPAFDRDHAARWGMALAFPDETMTDLVTDYQPDVVIETRGYNDLTWLQGEPAAVRAAMADEIEDARAVDPSVDFVLGEMPQVWKPNVSSFNDDLPGFALAQTQLDSQVVAAVPDGPFVQGVDTWDLAHYTASGELKFAAGIVDALADLGIGQDYPRPLPAVVNGHFGAATLSGVASEGRTDLTWVRPPGAFREFIWQRDVSAGEPWARLPSPVEGTSWSTTGLVNGHTYAYRLQAAKGEAISPGYSNEVRLVPNPPPPGAPTSLVVKPSRHRLDVTWAPAALATSYLVSWRGRRTGDHGSQTVVDPAIAIPWLQAGENYDVTVRPYNQTAPGPAALATGRPLGPVVAAPAGLRLAPAGQRLRLTWRPSREATSYALWQHPPGGRWTLVRTATAATLSVARPVGAMSYRVRAWHQLVPGGWSTAVRFSPPRRR